MPLHVTPQQMTQAQDLVRRLKGPDGLARVDIGKFWTDHEKAVKEPWAAACPQVPLGMARMSVECFWTELGEPEDWYRLTHDMAFRNALAKRYNDVSEKIVGRRLLAEDAANARAAALPIKALHEIFEAANVWEGQSYWLKQSAHGADELAALLDRVEKRLENLREFLLPPDWAKVKADCLAGGGKIAPYRGQRGPVTFAMSIFGAEDLIFLIMDNPGLAERFSRLILKAILARAEIIDQEAGLTPETAPRGWGWADDNCALLNKEMYDFFAKPILKGVFDRFCPGAADNRYQHSDSAMAQHLPTLGELGLNGCNFGPTLSVAEIRRHLPKAVIHGQLAPFTFSRNEEVNMVAEFIRDREMAREKRGLVFATAGSINDGSRLSGLRLLMAVAQTLGY